jgi:hypothetical protein
VCAQKSGQFWVPTPGRTNPTEKPVKLHFLSRYVRSSGVGGAITLLNKGAVGPGARNRKNIAFVGAESVMDLTPLLMVAEFVTGTHLPEPRISEDSGL